MSSKLNAGFSPPLLDRIKAYFGSDYALTKRLGVRRNYTTTWRQSGFIPEMWALDIEALGVTDGWGTITAYDVLREAAAVRRRRVAEAMEEERRALRALRNEARKPAG